MTLRGLLWGFGAAEQDEAGQVAINSPAAVEAVKLMATIYRESMIADVFMWDAASNNRAFVWGQASIIQNPISAIRSMEKSNPELAKQVMLAPPAAGPAARLAPANVLHCYVVWKFSDKIELAKRFLVDLVAASDEGFRASEFYNLPCFPRAVRDLPRKLGARQGRPGPEGRARAAGGPLRSPCRSRPLERVARAPGPLHAGDRRDAAPRGHSCDVRARRAR